MTIRDLINYSIHLEDNIVMDNTTVYYPKPVFYMKNKKYMLRIEKSTRFLVIAFKDIDRLIFNTTKTIRLPL